MVIFALSEGWPRCRLDADYAAAQAILDLGLFEVEPAEVA
jgi:hypothetical protein